MDFLSFLQAIGAATQLDIHAAAADGGCAIVFSTQWEVTFEHDEKTQAVLVFSPILSLEEWPAEARAHMLAQVLELHLFGLATEGNYFGFDSQRGRIIFFRNIALDPLTPAQAVTAVESFVDQLERWQPQLVQAPQKTTEPAPAVAGESRETPLQRV